MLVFVDPHSGGKSSVTDWRGRTMANRSISFWMLQGPGWLLLAYLVYAQAIPAFDYDLGVAMGTQESAKDITQVGAAFWYGFALADLLVYIPLLAAGLSGLWMGRFWGRILAAAALGITIYWPVVCLVAVVAARDAAGWNLVDETAYWIVLPVISIWATWGLVQIARLGQSKS
jgi:hypothetical protein